MNAEGRVRGEVGLREGGGGMLVRNEGECVDREDGRWWMMSHVLGEGSIGIAGEWGLGLRVC